MDGKEGERFCALGECGKLLVRKPGETKQNWKNRKTCDKVCAAKKTTRKRKRKGFVEKFSKSLM